MIIKITSTPPGGAPEWVRKCWKGVQLEGHPYGHMAGDVGVIDVITHSPIQEDRDFSGAFMTSSEYAIEVLKLSAPDAAGWWDENFNKVLVPTFIFPRECFEVM